MVIKYPMPPFTDEDKARILKGKTEQQKLGFKTHWALFDLSRFFEIKGDRRFYEVNKLIRACRRLWQEDDLSEK